MIDSDWVLPRPKLLRLTKVNEETLERFIGIGIIPSPGKILWLDTSHEDNCFPQYVVSDVVHLSYLEACGISTLWELQKFTLGAYGEVKHETDLRRLCRDLPYLEVHSDKEGAPEALCRIAEDCIPSKRIVGATFRREILEGGKYLVLSRVVLRPRDDPFEVQLVGSDSESHRKRLTESYELLMRRKG